MLTVACGLNSRGSRNRVDRNGCTSNESRLEEQVSLDEQLIELSQHNYRIHMKMD